MITQLQKTTNRWRQATAVALVSLTAFFAIPLIAPAHARALTEPVILVVGDSISAEYGLARGTGWVALLQARLQQTDHPHKVINASISGETTAGGKARIARLLAKHKPAIVVLELGGNDALRGLALTSTQSNLTQIAQQSRQAQARLLVLGIRVPPNYGQAYTKHFADIFTQLAQQHDAALIPSVLGAIENDANAFQPDRIHPTQAVQGKLLDTVWAELVPMLRVASKPK